jgi:hypothetical protein
MTKYKYVVSVTATNIDGDGNIKNEQFDYTFENGDLLTMRNEAIDKANDQIDFFEHEMPAGQEFDSPLEAELKGYKNIRCYSLSIFFFVDDLDYQIEGDKEIQEEMMEVEQREFIKNGFEYPFEIPKYDFGDTFDVDGNDFSHSPFVNNANINTNIKEHYQIDFAVGYDFNGMEQMIKGSAKEMGVSVKKYLKDGKKTFRNLGVAIMNEIAESNDPIDIGEMIEELNNTRCNWTLYERYDFERKLKPEER